MGRSWMPQEGGLRKGNLKGHGFCFYLERKLRDISKPQHLFSWHH